MYASVKLAVPNNGLNRTLDKMIDLWLQVATPHQQRAYYLNVLNELKKEKVIDLPVSLSELSTEEILAVLSRLPAELQSATTLAEYARRISIAGRTPRMVWLESGGFDDFNQRVKTGEIDWTPGEAR
jgi:hypothetical protein